MRGLRGRAGAAGVTGAVPLSRSAAWHALCIPGATFGAAGTTLNRLQAWPFRLEEDATLSAIAFHNASIGAAGSVARIGIYSSKRVAGLLEPDALIVDGGEKITTSTGKKETTGLAIALTKGTWYFAVYIIGVATANVTSLLTGTAVNIGLDVLGWDDANLNTGPTNSMYAAFAYAALPAAFPAITAKQQGFSNPLVYAQFV